MSRESADAKARRYLGEGRVTVDAVVPGLEIRHGVSDLGLGPIGPGALDPTLDLALGLIVAPTKENAS